MLCIQKYYQKSINLELIKKCSIEQLCKKQQNCSFFSKSISTTTKTHQKDDFNSNNIFISNHLNSEIAVLNDFQMLNSGSKPNAYTLVHLTRSCTNLGWLSHSEQLHCYILKSGYVNNVFVTTSLVNFYVKTQLLSNAQQLFDEMTEPNVVTWATLISGYVRSGQFTAALNLFIQLERSELCSDSYSFTAVLSACGSLGLVQLGKSIHSKIVKFGVECSIVVSNSLIDMYGKCGSVEESTRVFNSMIEKDTISWNSVIAANARNSRLDQAFDFLRQMPEPDTVSYNEVISGVAQFGNIEDAVGRLYRIPSSNSSSWNSIITGYVNRGRAQEALRFFQNMHLSNVLMDQFTFSSILSGIANIAAITWGRLMHCCTVKYGVNETIVVGTAVVDMYSKCGQMNEADALFRSLPQKNLITWNTIISGHAHNGNSDEVIRLFEQLKLVKDLQPDGITFLNVLAACWHNKMSFEAANEYFELMVKEYEICPMPEHCSSMIGLMGQEGDVSKAEKMIYELGFENCGLVWKALLGASVTCGDIKIAEVAAAKVIELEGDNEFVYVLMSNMYALHRKWIDVGGMREQMKEKRVRKEAGWSWIELVGVGLNWKTQI
ncbi:LOW QUALITY PROTEIN: putative pentatricopeptide repeat-containing protein At5g47460 [Lycium ferocissimum]|uniref:LOW QUALITY PROTEIN: putative pentatricopeptide repeat-containing protein At5g47460 n=1 Tax=Lycium ferocissimum TaxID=112874 RepID=UPI002815F12D|nr:LOW QUALITY PROTEIN: putative pentatricopeptide repeat-containing protein At5g47460 [Lycium ferocissimum]